MDIMGKDDIDLEQIIRVETLLNAKLHDGNPNAGSIMGKIMGQNPELRSEAQKVNKLVGEEVQKVKAMGMEKIEEELLELDPEAEKRHKKKKERIAARHEQKRQDIAELPNAEEGNFIVRYAPDPSKYPHLGQGINYMINRHFADKYDGKVILRFDDTNPTIVKEEYYNAIKDGLRWIGADWDEEIRASQYIEEFYEITKEWIELENFYVCFCEGSDLAELREIGEACQHRGHSIEENLEYFDKMINGEYEIGTAIVRLVGDMKSDNNVMRDPIMLRIVKDKHPMLDKFYPVMPTYDFESPFLEYKMGVTHVIRSGEFGQMRREQQSFIIKKLGGKVPEFTQFGRVNIQGCPTKGSLIRKLVNDGVVEGWDDLRLITLQALQRRGIHHDIGKALLEKVGLSPQNSTIPWSQVEALSRQLLEPESRRLFFVNDPVKMEVKNAPDKTVEYPYHPDHPEYGKRSLHTKDIFYISKTDAEPYEEGTIFRLKDLYNVKIETIEDTIIATYEGEKLIDDTDKIQWVTDEYIELTLDVPKLLEDEQGNINPDSMAKMTGYIETNAKSLDDGTVVQLERVGFAKLYISEGLTGHMVHTL